MESVSREAMTMKYENQLPLIEGQGELDGLDNHHPASNGPNSDDNPLSFKSSLDEMGIFHQESSHSLLPSLEPSSLSQLSNSSKSVAQHSDHNLLNETILKSKFPEQDLDSVLSGDNSSSKLKFGRLNTPSLFDACEPGLGKDIMSIMNLLHPPSQIGSTKVKRGPGRPRKDSFATGKNQRHSSGQKMKGLLGAVRGRKKSSMENLVGGSNLALSSAGDGSIGDSPPRIAEDTAESDSSSVASSLEKLHEDFSLFPEKWPGKVCGFCCLGERSMLGQGELLRLELREDFDPVLVAKGLKPAGKNEKDNTIDKNQKPGVISRRQKGSAKIKLVSQSSLESINEPADEVCGYVEEPEYSSVFDSLSGHYYAHQQCGVWCNGVETNEDGTFRNLDSELVRALNQRCHHCGNLGAGLVCKVDNCDAILHFPCTALSGAFQNSVSRAVACFSHLESSQSLVEVITNCTVCDSKGDISTLMMCSSCGRHYHGSCMAVNSDPSARAGWQCPACKLCQACRQPGDESKLLACDTCDKAYHIFCIRPALSSIPKHSWKCKMCRICTDCGARTPGSGPSSRWHANFSVCDSCYQQRNKGLACPLCGKAYRHVAQKLMLQCHLCKKYVHGTCDPAADLTTYQQRKELYPDYEYICTPCKAAGTGLNTLGGNPRVLSALKRTDKEENDDGISVSNLAASQDSIWSIEDDSFPGIEASNNDLMWLDKCLSTSMEDIKPNFHQPQPPFKDKQIANIDKLQKKKLMPGRPKGIDKLGQIPPTSNSRKNRFNEFAKKRGPKPKLRLFGSSRVCLSRNSTDGFSKSDEEPGVENRMVLCSAKDEYVLQQDACVMCGAFGCDFEGRLISCAQCGQCYHPYCVNVKVTKVVLLKGWRCLDCTVCEGCGQRNDESRLILCDECDVSFHIYCIDPPLEKVPHGTWKCKWCAVCYYCGSNDPGYSSSWHENYTKCGPCASQATCPVCSTDYNEGDLVIKCFQCERWLHSQCDMIKDTDDAEKCAEEGYCCVLCRPNDTLPPHLRPPPKIIAPKIETTPPKSPIPPTKSGNQFLIDGIYLSDFGVNQIKSLTLDIPKKKRKKIVPIADMEAGIMAVIESVVSGGDTKDDMGDIDKDSKKRQRNIQKLGIGGFLVRLRAPRYKDDDHDGGSDLNNLDGEKPKRKPAQRRKIKNKLVETFPMYLQEAFFGKGLMEPSNNLELATTDEPDTDSLTSLNVESTINLSIEEIQEIEDIKSRKSQDSVKLISKEIDKNSKQIIKESSKTDRPSPKINRGSSEIGLSDIMPVSGDMIDNVFVDTIMTGRPTTIKIEDDLVDSQLQLGNSHVQIDRNSDENGHKDELTDFLSSQFNLESMDSGLPSMDSKDVEDIFKGVLVEESKDNSFSKNPNIAPIQQKPLLPSGVPMSNPTSNISNVSIIQPSSQGSPNVVRNVPVQPNLSSPVSFPPPSPYHSEYSNSPQFSPAFSEPPSPWPAPVADDTDQPSSYNQRSILKWEADEALGANATISAVLYANVKHPELKRDVPTWAERSKQIAKIWRGLPSEARAPFLQQARENRAASRMQKAQQDQEKLMTGGQPKTTIRVETQEERQWKQIQALRQQQSQQPSPISDATVKDTGGNMTLNVGTGVSQIPFQPPVNQGVYTPRGISTDSNVMSHPSEPRMQHHIMSPHHEQQKLPGMHSPQMQSPGPRPTTPMNSQQPHRPEMPPPVPSPVFGPRGVTQGLRSPVYTRLPFNHSPRPQNPSPSDLFGHLHTQEQSSHMQPIRSFSDSEGVQSMNDPSHYGQTQGNPIIEVGELGSPNRPSPTPQGQETRQHLRDLLQRQQVKKLEQDQVSPTTSDGNQLIQQRPAWSHDEWQKSGLDSNQMVRHPIGSPVSRPTHPMNQFRQPFLPPHARVPSHSQNPVSIAQPMNRPNDFRLQTGHSPTQGVDSRARMLMSQPRGMIPISNVNRQQPGFHTNQFQQSRNPLDPYGHLVVQQQRMQGGGIVESPGNSMLAQQLGRPLNQQSVLGNQQGLQELPQQQQHMMQSSPSQSQSQVGPGNLPESNNSNVTSPMQTDHQELPDNVTAELEKLEQEQHNDSNHEVELADIGMDDDDLLGMGADFNILEYADPELDQVLGGEKTNILDNLDLEEEEKEEKEPKRKEEPERGSKKEDATYPSASTGKQIIKSSSSPKGTEMSPNQPSRGMNSPNNSSYTNHGVNQLEGGKPIMRPAQPPPPPYPGPPPPYPGRVPQQMGIRNGFGVNINVMGAGVGAKNAGVGSGGQPPYPQLLPPAALQPNSNTPLSLHQRRTLLLQEQPLLLEDLLEQEKREQLRQGSGLINAAPEEPLLSDFEFERLKADVFSNTNLPVSISPPNVVGQNVINMPSQPPGMLNRHHSTSAGSEWQLDDGSMRRQDVPPVSAQDVQPGLNIRGGNAPPVPGSINQTSSSTIPNRLPNFPLQSLPPPPNPPEHPATEQERQMQIQYEQWLYSQQQVLGMHLKCFETEVHKLRKSKKSLNSKQRQLRKNGNELNENDAAEMERIGKELPGLQKQLDQARKQSRQHNLLIQDYRNKQQKRQQIMGMGPNAPVGNMQQGNMPTQPSPLGAASSSPLHSTPQSPMLSPSPSLGGPSPSPLMQHSPMASPLTPSPGPASVFSQTSPRGNPHGLEDINTLPFSPNAEGSNRPQNINPARMQGQHHMPQIRMGSPGMSSHQIMIPQSGGMNINVGGKPGNAGHMMVRSMNPQMVQQMQSQQRAMMETQHGMQRMRSLGPQDQMRNMNPMNPRFQRMGIHQDLMIRSRPPSNNFSTPSQMAMSPASQQYNQARVPFPIQSPTGNNMNAGSLRSPSPMTPMGGLGSPPNQMMMAQNRSSPASSPMRRPSGSGSIGNASPMPERPQSVENPLTPRNSTSRPHTPSAGGLCQNIDNMSVQLQQHSSPMENQQEKQHYINQESCGMGNLGSPPSHTLQNYLSNPNEYVSNNPNHPPNDYNAANRGGGGGGTNIQMLPFPVFSFFDGPHKLGLKGGNPFSVVSEHTPSTSNTVSDHPPPNNTEPGLSVLTQVSRNSQETLSTTSSTGSSSQDTNEQENNSISTEPDPFPDDSNTGETGIVNSGSNKLGTNSTEVLSTNSSHDMNSIPNLTLFQNQQTLTRLGNEQIDSTIQSNDSKSVAISTPTEFFQNNQSVKTEIVIPIIPIITCEPQEQQLSIQEQSKTTVNASNSNLDATSVIPKENILEDKSNSNLNEAKAQSINNDNEANINQIPTELTVESNYAKQNSNCIIVGGAVNPLNSSDYAFSPSSASLQNRMGSGCSSSSFNSMLNAELQKPTMTSLSTTTTTNIISTSSGMTSFVQMPITGESQNALLKQLLQNTGCASTAQTSENVGFSLTSCLSRPTTTTAVVHTSHLSEAATRIPQPNPTIRPPRASDSPGPQIAMVTIKSEPVEIPSPISTSAPFPRTPEPEIVPIRTIESESPVPIISPAPVLSRSLSTNHIASPLTPTLGQTSEVKEEKTPVDNIIIDTPPSKITDSKKLDDEVKKAKRRQYQSKRKQATGKDASTPKKRPRKSGKPEEDYDGYIENLMTQLRQLPPIGIMEPKLGHCQSICPVYGAGDFTKLNTKDYGTRFGDLNAGTCKHSSGEDFYNSKPFGKQPASTRSQTSASHRGFYNQEFASPRTSSVDKSQIFGRIRTPSPIRESDTPDTIVSCSSPEFCENQDSFPGLKLIETDEDKLKHLRDSPSIPIVYPVPIRPLLAAKLLKEANEADKENADKDTILTKGRSLGPLKENGSITVTLTLSATAVDDIRGVLRNLANILSIAQPSYQVQNSKTNGPPDKKFFTYKTKDGNQAVDIQSILNGAAKFCKHCDVVMLSNHNITKKVSDMPGEQGNTSSDDYSFCGTNCYMQFSISHGVALSSQDKVQAVVKHTNYSKPEIKTERQQTLKDCRNGPVPSSFKFTSKKANDADSVESIGSKRSLSEESENQEPQIPKKKWKNIRYKEWSATTIPFQQKYKKPTDKELTELLFRLGITFMPRKVPEDSRRCIFCLQIGDGVSDGPGRLLNYDVDKWVHLNCALWSEEVYETENGALVNVEVAIKQCAPLTCIICQQLGASVKCFKVRCTSLYHVGCAAKDGCSFYKNKSVFCQAHVPKGEKENELTSLSVFRRVYIQRDENRQVAAVMHQVDQNHLLRVGSLIFLSVGQLLPHQLHSFHTRNYIYPVGYKIVRFYWSMTRANKRCQYICSIHDVDGKPEFRITTQEESEKERVIKSDTAQGAWVKVLESVSKTRNANDSIKVFPKYITGEDLFGLTEPAIVKVLESLPGIETLTDYHFKYGRNPLLELPLAINPSGCARSEPKLRTHFKRPHTQRTGASRASLPTSVLSSSEAACPYSKQFVHSKSSQYKKMKQEWRNNVYLARSKIQGLGLYAARDIEKHTMVIEYIGEIIRNELAEAREKKYEAQNRGIYMFRMDDERVIDATLCGGLARYVNHSCNPNCVAETVEVDRDVRIIIFANRRISRGEELAYDYKFEFEDDQHKIPCLCGAHNCQKWMN